MNSHKNARLTFEGSKLLIEHISLQTACKWRKRFAMLSHEGLDRSQLKTTTNANYS